MAGDETQSKDTPTATNDDILTSKYTPTAVTIIPDGTAATAEAAAHDPKKVKKGHKASVYVRFEEAASEGGTLTIIFTCPDGSDPKKIIGVNHLDVAVNAGDTGVTSDPVHVANNALTGVIVTATAIGGADPSDDMKIVA